MSREDKIVELLENIDLKLGVIVGEKIRERSEVIREQVAFLHKRGMKTSEIAKVLGITSTHASKELSVYKKKVKS